MVARPNKHKQCKRIGYLFPHQKKGILKRYQLRTSERSRTEYDQRRDKQTILKR